MEEWWTWGRRLGDCGELDGGALWRSGGLGIGGFGDSGRCPQSTDSDQGGEEMWQNEDDGDGGEGFAGFVAVVGAAAAALVVVVVLVASGTKDGWLGGGRSLKNNLD